MTVDGGLLPTQLLCLLISVGSPYNHQHRDIALCRQASFMRRGSGTPPQATPEQRAAHPVGGRGAGGAPATPAPLYTSFSIRRAIAPPLSCRRRPRRSRCDSSKHYKPSTSPSPRRRPRRSPTRTAPLPHRYRPVRCRQPCGGSREAPPPRKIRPRLRTHTPRAMAPHIPRAMRACCQRRAVARTAHTELAARQARAACVCVRARVARHGAHAVDA